jgi:hypothetical protein
MALIYMLECVDSSMALDRFQEYDVCQSFIIRWHFVLDIADKCDPDLCSVVPSEDVGNEVRFDLHLYLRRSAFLSSSPR